MRERCCEAVGSLRHGCQLWLVRWRFHETLAWLHSDLGDASLEAAISDEQFLQGAVADATHAGQLAMLRRLAGASVPSEDFIYARIDTNNVSPDQAAPAAPDVDWRPDAAPRPPGPRHNTSP